MRDGKDVTVPTIRKPLRYYQATEGRSGQKDRFRVLDSTEPMWLSRRSPSSCSRQGSTAMGMSICRRARLALAVDETDDNNRPYAHIWPMINAMSHFMLLVSMARMRF